MLTVNRRLDTIFTNVELKPPSGCWRPLFARPDIGAIRLWLDAFLDPRGELLDKQPSDFLRFTRLAKDRGPRILSVYELASCGSITHWVGAEQMFGLARYTKV
jgi:hypothetical protein